MSVCRSCKAGIGWAVTAAGKRMPIDPLPCEDGNVLIGWVGGERVALVLGPDDRAAAQIAGKPLHISHFATCPNAMRHRKEDGA